MDSMKYVDYNVKYLKDFVERKVEYIGNASKKTSILHLCSYVFSIYTEP